MCICVVGGSFQSGPKLQLSSSLPSTVSALAELNISHGLDTVFRLKQVHNDLDASQRFTPKPLCQCSLAAAQRSYL